MPEENKHIINDEFLARILSGEAEAEERIAFGEWLNIDDKNLAIYEDYKRAWEKTGRIKNYNTDREFEKIRSSISGNRNNFLFLKIVAAAILVFVSGYFFIGRFFPDPSGLVVATSTDNPREVVLPDGSLVVLGDNTRISYKKGFEKERTIVLEGNAFFEVTRKPDLPFTVNMDKTQVRVLGTSFYINERGDSVSLQVASGKVSFSVKDAPEKQLILTKAQAASYTARTGEIKRAPEPDLNEFAPLSRTLIFEDTELNVVFEVVENLYEINIEVEDTSIYSCRLTATFKKQEKEEILRVIAETFDLKFDKENGIYLFRGEGCKD